MAAENRVCRVRIAGDEAFLTLKSSTDGIVRSEFEYSIPLNDANEMLELLCEDRVLRKTRYRIDFAGKIWEVDVFHGKCEGLVVAEIELERVDQEVEFPEWVGKEVSSDPRYYNAALATCSVLPVLEDAAGQDEKVPELNIVECFSVAWRSFQKWWIPICLVAGLIFIFNILPRIVAGDQVSAIRKGGAQMINATTEMDVDEMEDAAYKLESQFYQLALEFLKIVPLILPLTAVLTIVLLLYANRAAAHERKSMRLPFWRVLHTALMHFVLALVKTIAFLCCMVPGVYIYIKLYFVPLIMIEEGCGVVRAVRASWIMTAGNFWKLFTIVVINGTIQIAALPTIIGAIPATGYANTVRATAYRQLLDMDREEGRPEDRAV